MMQHRKEGVINHRQIIFARKYRGYTQSQVVKVIQGLTLARLVRIEAGLEKVTKEEMNNIATFLNFPIEFFECYIYNQSISKHYMKP